MTPHDLVTAVRLEFIKRERDNPLRREFIRCDPSLAKIRAKRSTASTKTARRRAANHRSVRWRRRDLFKSRKFRELAAGFLKGQVADPVSKLVELVDWLDSIKVLTHLPNGPRHFFSQRANATTEDIATLRDIAQRLPGGHSKRLLQLAKDIDADNENIRLSDGSNIANINNVAQTASDSWRSLFVKELYERLPALKTPSMIAHLLAWAGIAGIYDQYVRSVLKKGRTSAKK